MKKTIIILLCLSFVIPAKCQNLQQQIVGHWYNCRVSASIICEGKIYEDVIVQEYTELNGLHYYFNYDNTLGVGKEKEYIGRYKITQDSILILDYSDGEISYNEFPESVKYISNSLMITERGVTDIIEIDDIEYFILEHGFNKQFAPVFRNLAGKQITMRFKKEYMRIN